MPVGTWLGVLQILEVYETSQGEGPTLVSCINERGEVFLAARIATEGVRHWWWYVSISTARLELVRSGKLAVREALVEPESRPVVVTSGPEAPNTADVVDATDTFDLSFLDSFDFRLSLDSPLQEVFATHERVRLAGSLRSDIIDVRLVGESTRYHAMDVEPLRRFLAKWFDFIRQNASTRDEPFDSKVYGFGAGSFVVRITGGAGSLDFVPSLVHDIACADTLSGMQAALPTPTVRETFRQLASALDEDGVSLVIHHSGRNGSGSSATLPVERVRVLRETIGVHRTLIETCTITGVLETASTSARRMTFIDSHGRVIVVDVARELAHEIRGRRIGTEYSVPVRKASVRNAFDDEVEVTHELLPANAEATPGADGYDSRATRHPNVLTRTSQDGPLVVGRTVRRWAKKLSDTDVVRTNSGNQTLRLTRSDNVIGDPNSWFRDELIVSDQWSPQRWGRRRAVAESIDVHLVVVWPNERPRVHTMRVTHDPKRRLAHSHSQPVTWLHWDNQSLMRFRDSDFRGMWVSIERDEWNNIILRFLPAKPAWHGRPQPVDGG